MKNKIYTYFEELGGEDQTEILNLWKQSWEQNGFEAIILNQSNAESSPYYEEFLDSVEKIHMDICGSRLSQYGLSCYLRWLAYSTQEESESFFVSDYDVVNRCLSSSDINEPTDKITFLDRYCPCFAYGTKEQFLSFCKDIVLYSNKNKQFLKKEYKRKGYTVYHDQNFLSLNCGSVNYNICPVRKYVALYTKDYETLTKHKAFHVAHRTIDEFTSSSPGLDKLSLTKIRQQLIIELLNKDNKYLGVIGPSSLKTQPPKIPIYLHFPRCGGTYTTRLTANLYRLYAIQKSWNSKRNWNLDLCRFLLTDSGKQIGIIFAYDPLKKRINNVNFTEHSKDHRTYYCEIDNFIKDLKIYNFNLFSIVLKPDGLCLLDSKIDDILNIAGTSGLRYTNLRDPFEREQSLYNYSKGNSSSHELISHKFLESKTFIDHIKSKDLHSNWYIRVLTNFKSMPCTEKDFNEAVKLLDTFKVCDINNIDKLFDEVFQECYWIDSSEIEDKSIINRNDSQGETIKFKDLDDELKNYISKNMELDIKLYRKYCT